MCRARHRFLPQRSCKLLCSLVLSAARRSPVLVSMGGRHGRLAMSRAPSLAVGAVRGLERRSLVLACSFCSLGGRVVSTVFVVCRRFGFLLLSVCCVFRRAAPAAVVGWGWGSCSRALLVPAVFYAATSSIVLVSVGGRARSLPVVSCAFRRGAVGLGSRRAASRAAACVVVICSRAPLWSLGGL